MFFVALLGFIGIVNDVTLLIMVYLIVVFLSMWALLGFTSKFLSPA